MDPLWAALVAVACFAVLEEARKLSTCLAALEEARELSPQGTMEELRCRRAL